MYEVENIQKALTITTLWANLADDKLMIFFLFFFFLKKKKKNNNRVWHFIKNVSIGDNLYEMSKPIFWEK